VYRKKSDLCIMSFSNPIEQVVIVNKTLSEIRLRKELWKIKERVTKLRINIQFDCLVFGLQIINHDEK
jgi:hypothetical protein